MFGREHKNKLELLADRTSIIQPDNIWSWFSPTGAGVSNLPLSLLFNEVTRSPSDTIGSGFMSNLFDGTVLSSLDKQAAIHRNGPIATGGNEAANLGEYQEWPGIVPIDAAHLDKIWRDVEKEKKAMLYQVGPFLIKFLLSMLTEENSERGI